MDEDGSIPWQVVLARLRLRWCDLVGQTRLGFLRSDVGCGGFFLVAGRRASYWRVSLSGLPFSSEASRAAAGFQGSCWSLVVQRQVLWGYGLSPGPSSSVSLRWVNLLHFSLAQFALGNMVPFFVVVSYLAVLFPVSGYCSWSTGIGFFGRCCLSLERNA